MALLLGSYSTTQTATVLVPAVPQRRIRVLRMLLSTEQAGTFTLIAAPGQPEAAPITNAINVATQTAFDWTLGADAGVSTPPGQALGLTTTIANTKLHGLLLWYEIVD